MNKTQVKICIFFEQTKSLFSSHPFLTPALKHMGQIKQHFRVFPEITKQAHPPYILRNV